jgi:hypothetical protein
MSGSGASRIPGAHGPRIAARGRRSARGEDMFPGRAARNVGAPGKIHGEKIA